MVKHHPFQDILATMDRILLSHYAAVSPEHLIVVLYKLQPLEFLSTYSLKMSELNDLFYQLPSPVLLLGVFNGTTTQWDFSSFNPRGNLDAKFINKNDLCLLIYSSPTFLHSSKGSYSNLDLTLTFLSIR